MQSDINLTPTGSLVEIGKSQDERSNIEIIPGRTWGTASECRAAALLVHGLGAHSGWYEALGRRLRVKRFFSLAYDQVGFGKRRSQTLMMKQQWLDDIRAAYEYLRETVGDKPIFIMGNSMGALLSLKAASELNKLPEIDRPAGLVLFSPGFDGHPETFRLTYKAKAVFKALFDPDEELNLPYTYDDITREETVRNWLKNDPDKREKLPARMLLELLKLSQEVKSSVRKVPCPVLMLTSGKEKIVDNEVNRMVFERLNAPRKTQHRFEEAWHDLMFDPVLDELVEMVTAWMIETTKQRQTVG
ncbi:MAG: alpha/beta hydrolase [Candidatus Melainabacteria bacterium]|jgi:alpha-beta hydrolase superfamily lysophospholipase|uniref:Alpha/beta fold hydrolase n=1 Tax=Candidatus Obscuribacter phosphatis TaxID=1906157 RepID=A0A8J7P8J1_9BACT|nr:alpha/beta fold hydrolase [Candidatus Obscuribacter phosphatis]MCA0313725.1 alpha/beta hydrolase [Candidatus Melainabacteria bacterium]OPZ89569.1 MAG: Phospholipase YtpA [bacterium ADurb.Bin425]